MTRLLVLAPMAAIALAACGGGSDSTNESAAETGEISLTNASVEEVAAQTKARGGKSPAQPGMWEQTLTVVSANADGASPAEKAAVDALRSAGQQTSRSCIEDSSARVLDPETLAQAAKDCRFERFRTGRTIDVDMRCTALDGSPLHVTMNGTQTATELNVDIEQEGTVSMTMKIEGKRVGDCPE